MAITERIIFDCKQNPYTVIAASSEELKTLPDGLFLDRRISQRSDEWQNGLHPDLDHSRFQVFLVKNKTEVIGLTTLFIVPYKDLSKQGCLEVKKDIVSLKPITKILDIQNPNTLMMECGFTQLLPDYRGKKLGIALLNEIIFPKALDLRKRFSGDIFFFCSAQGVESPSFVHRIQNVWNQYLQGACGDKISIPMDNLGKIAPQAKFTEQAAMSLGLKRLENIFHFRLGPVFVRKI
jgi:hypothetical protein